MMPRSARLIETTLLVASVAVLCTSPSVGQAPFDLTARQHDANGLLLNPRWVTDDDPLSVDPVANCGILALHGPPGFRRVLVKDTTCFSYAQRRIMRLNEARRFKFGGAICNQPAMEGSVQGHVNWFPLTLTGLLRFDGWSGGRGGDYDLNFELLSDKPLPITRWNWENAKKILDGRAGSIHLEFDRRETTGRRLPQGTWWSVFDSLVRSSTRDSIDKHLGKLPLVTVTGLFGLDLVHGGHAEIHPVYAMTILIRADTSSDRTRIRETWAFLARDRGNEGNCAAGTVPFRLGSAADSVNEYRVVLGGPPGTNAAPEITRDSSWFVVSNRKVRGPAFRWARNEGLEMSFRWPRAEEITLPAPAVSSDGKLVRRMRQADASQSPDALTIGVFQVVWSGSFGARVTALSRTGMLLPLAELATSMRQLSVSDLGGPRFEPPGPDHPGKTLLMRQPDLRDDEAFYYDSVSGPLGPLSAKEPVEPFVQRVDTLPSADTVRAVGTEVFDLLPPVLSCHQVRLLENPRCVGEWSVVPGVGMGGGWAFALGIESPRKDFLNHNLHPRVELDYVIRQVTDTSGRSQTLHRLTLPLGLGLGPLPLTGGAYLIAQAEPSVLTDDSWRLVAAGSVGAGWRVRNGYEFDLAAEGLCTWVHSRGRYCAAFIRVPVVVP